VTDGSLLAFVGIAAIVIVTPGQDTALTIRTSLLGGRSAGIATAAGVALGQACWTLAASLGLTALLIASEPAFAAVRYLGAAYLVYLGAHSLWSAIRSRDRQGHERRDVGESGLQPRRAFRQGVLSNLGNPKMAVFFSSLLPQFVPAGPTAFATMLGLGLLFVSMTLAWLSLYAVVVSRAGDLLRRPRIRRTIDAVSGALLVAFGVRLATEPN
jgi:threonine/homoserine/homoserine lactone efflux protein